MPIILSPPIAWMLKDPNDDTHNIQLNVIGDAFNRSKREEQAVFNILGRSNVVVVADVLRGWHFNLHLEFLTDADWNAFQTIRSVQRPLLLQRVYTNEQWYVRLGEMLELTEAPTFPIYRTLYITAEEVDFPTV